MTVEKQLRYLIFILSFLLSLLAVFVVLTVIGFRAVGKTSALLSRSIAVQNQLKEIEYGTQIAINLRQAATFDVSADYLPERAKVFAALKELKISVEDGGEQQTNAENLEKAIAKRFDAQERLYSHSETRADGSLVFGEADRQLSLQAQAEAAQIFYKIKTFENASLIEQLNNLLRTLWLLFVLIAVVIIAKLTVNVFGYVQIRRALLKDKTMISNLQRGIVESTATGEKKILVDVELFEQWIKYLDGGEANH